MSVVSICNSALIKLGQQRINDITEDNKRAILCNEQYNKIRKKTLASHLWNFALRRQELALTANKLAYGPENEFQLPNDVLSVLLVNDNDNVKWYIEDDKLYSDHDSIFIWYISDITDSGKFRSYFAELLAWELAFDLSYALVESNTFRQALKIDLAEERTNAYFMDAREGTPIGFPIDHFTSARSNPEMSKYHEGWY